MASPEIIRIPILPMGMVNAHLIKGDGGCVLVDAGLPGSEVRVERALQGLGLGWRDLKLIVVTHAHVDHAGAAAALRRRSGAKIVAHAEECAHLNGEKPMTFCPTGWFGRFFVQRPPVHQRYEVVAPDVVLSEGKVFDLAPLGLDGQIAHTPGHTRGSISVTLGSGDALVGDLLASGILLGGIARRGHAIRPPFEEDPVQVATELERLVASGAQTFHMGHGGPLPAAEVLRHARALRKAKVGEPQRQRGFTSGVTSTGAI